jgi:hypothetical protein
MKRYANTVWSKGAFALGAILVGTSMGGSFQSALAQQSVDIQEGGQQSNGAVAPQNHTGLPVNLALSSVIHSRPGNFIFNFPASIFVPLTSSGATQSVPFTTSGHVTVQYTAECAVGAPAGNTATWLNIDLELRNVATGAVIGLSPTNQTQDAFCTANGVAGIEGGWAMHSITGVATTLPAGTYVARVRANLQFAGAGMSGWLGDSSLIIRK